MREMLPEQLVPINQITKQFRVDKTRLAYLAKLHLIPPAIRRKLANGQIAGCYPESVIATVKRVEQLKKEGFSYCQIKAQLSIINSTTQVQANKFNLALAFSAPVFLLFGILVGFILAGANKPVSPVILAKSDYQKILKAEPSGQTDQLIYIISTPTQSLDKLGQTGFTNLTN